MSATPCPRCGTVFDVSRTPVCAVCLLAGDVEEGRFAGLDLDQELGRGGMGRVYRAHDPKLGRDVAVKLLADELLREPEMRARFEREAMTLARLHHPNIVSIFGAGEEDGQPYLVMELVAGRSLAELVPMATDAALRVGIQVARALAYAHAQGVVHRDIKPTNILVTGDGSVKVTDFGIARAISGDAGLTSPQTILGTPEYMAPESFLSSLPDPRMDVYALGVVLRTLVTGSPIANEGDPRLRELGGVIRRATTPEKERRYVSATELLEALERVRAGQDPSFPPDERLWMRAVATLHAVSIGLFFWAGLSCLTPQWLDPGDLKPLTMTARGELSSGKVLTLARFDTGPVLGALAGISLALAAYGLLRRHWRKEGWDHPEPERPVRESRTVLVLGLIGCLVYVPRVSLDANRESALGPFFPVAGGLMLLFSVYAFSFAVLETQRRGRRLLDERGLLAGAFLVLIPPVSEFLRYVMNFRR